MAPRKRKSKLPPNWTEWISGEIKIEANKNDEALFEVISIQQEGENLVREFNTKKSAKKFFNTINRLQIKDRQKGILVSCYTRKRTQKTTGQKECRVCGRHPLMGEDFCSDHI